MASVRIMRRPQIASILLSLVAVPWVCAANAQTGSTRPASSAAAAPRTTPAAPNLPNFAPTPDPAASSRPAAFAPGPATTADTRNRSLLRGTSEPWLGDALDAPRTAADQDPEPADLTGSIPTAPTRPRRPAIAPLPGPTSALRPTVTPQEPVTPAPATQPTTRTEDLDPYAEPVESEYDPLGFRVGGLTVIPTLETGLGYSSNIDGRARGTAGSLYRTNGELIGRSDWSRHELDFTLRGSFTGYPSLSSQNRPEASAQIRGRIDASETTRITLEARSSVQRESTTSANNPANTSIPSTATRYGATVGVTQQVGRLSLGLRGEVDRNTFSGGELVSGAPIASGPDRNNVTSLIALRSTYELSPAIKPFVEAQYRRLVFDSNCDAGCFNRNGEGWGLRSGIEFDNGATLRGEVGVGYIVLNTDDVRLGTLRTATLDGTLAWSPSRLTTVTLSLATALEPTSVANSAGSISLTGTAALSHALRRNIDLSLVASHTVRDYQGVSLRETETSATAGLTYKFNREVGAFVRSTLSHTTTSGGADVNTLEVFAGLRLTR